jgi:hypothetical protein
MAAENGGRVESEREPVPAQEATAAERDVAAVGRSQNTLYLLPHDSAAVAEFLTPALDRVDRGAGTLHVLVITSDPESAVEIARAAVALPSADGVRILPVTGAQRAHRLLKDGAPHVAIGAPEELAALIRAAVLKLEHVRSLVIAWADLVLAAGHADALEAVMAEVPKEAARTVVATRATGDVEQLVERYARRAGRRGAVITSEHVEPADIRVVSVGTAARRGARFTAVTTHYGLLRTIEAAWGLPFLGRSARAKPLTGIWR